MDDLDTFLVSQQFFSARVHAVVDDQWTLRTPAVDWNVADLVAHLVDEHRWAAPLVNGHDLDAAAKIVDGGRSLPVDGGVGGNLAQAWDVASAGSADAFSADGALDRTVALFRGDTAARDYLHELVFDLTVHAWDLQRAIGFDGDLPESIVRAVYDQVSRIGDLSASGLFDAPVPVPDDAPLLDRLAALTGRDPAGTG